MRSGLRVAAMIDRCSAASQTSNSSWSAARSPPRRQRSISAKSRAVAHATTRDMAVGSNRRLTAITSAGA
jgi:hypothetical protein